MSNICPICSNLSIKNGFIRGIQRYKCKECGYNFLYPQKRASIELKQKAIILYMEGLSFRNISKIIGYSDVTILKWIKKSGELIKKINIANKSNKEVIHGNWNNIDSKIIKNNIIIESGALVSNNEIFIIKPNLPKQNNKKHKTTTIDITD